MRTDSYIYIILYSAVVLLQAAEEGSINDYVVVMNDAYAFNK